jgi:hypothetical protein
MVRVARDVLGTAALPEGTDPPPAGGDGTPFSPLRQYGASASGRFRARRRGGRLPASAGQAVGPGGLPNCNPGEGLARAHLLAGGGLSTESDRTAWGPGGARMASGILATNQGCVCPHP